MALESGFSSFNTEIASMFASLTGRLTASHPPDPKAGGSRLQDGGAHGGEIFPSRELEDPLASQRSGPSSVMEPRGTTSHTATAMVSGPVRSRDRLSNNSPTSAETAQADLLTPLSSTSVESQPSRLEVIKGFHKERGFSEAVAQRLAISQRQSSAGVYESKWKVFGEWCPC